MKKLTLVFSVLAAQFLTGCFQTATAIRIKPDGSGTLLKVFSMSTEAAAQARQMQPAGPGRKLPTQVDEDQLKTEARNMGEGVSFVSAKTLGLPGRDGYVATYAFTDITKVQVTLGAEVGSAGGGPGADSKEEPITFEFTKGPIAQLVIHTPQKNSSVGVTVGGEETGEEMLPMMAQVLKDLRVSFVVDVQGTLVKTNASNRQGQRLTIMDVEFGKLLADPVKLKAMAKIKDPTSPEAKAMLKAVPGVQIELENPIRVSFK